MTLFGRTLGAEEIAGLVFLLMTLVMWIVVWRRDRGATRWFRGWEADRRSRREAELSAEQDDRRPPPASDGPRGPWG
ncbi:hypothetical protein [Brevundimonas sp. Root1279]|uniref:hypothetical protein n=1 Tax=Brevundimonas sp. Root1279 TaxID=1736443 RepID=UPI0006FCC3B7|nr:hypothetical protein [Brevundimonas sp. Root1279]KQW80907.1 hypothetical protein ASC65_13140 [Brevundimonas sp. Root1279]